MTQHTTLCFLLLLPAAYPDVFGVLPLCDAHHPKELVDVVAGVADDPPKDDQDVVDIQRPHDFIGCSLIGGHGFTHLDRGKQVKG